VAQVGGDGEIAISYRGVDKAGLMSAAQTVAVKVASTPPTATAADTSVRKGQRATFACNVTAVTPAARSSSNCAPGAAGP